MSDSSAIFEDKIRIQNSKAMELGNDLIVQIVRWLPFKSVIDCRFVSKRWCFSITQHLALSGKYDPCGPYLHKAEYLLGLIDGKQCYPKVENHTILRRAKVYLFKAQDNLIKLLFIHGMNEFEKDAEDSKSSDASFISLKKKWFENLAKLLMDMTKRFNICIKDWDRTGTTSSGGAIILDIHCCCRKHDLKRRKRGGPMVRDEPWHQQSTVGMCSVPEYGAWRAWSMVHSSQALWWK
ncbi:hypothetical protein CKAN_02474000 [Cinnamomum micranthum f. kanehirae]|uniref:F-box domain-containing protein n=1 Tax=Cinnamomum micranthum f. kanehirae TaxID=337451 RepID=A0A3S3NHU6_9MAGN|nr:hypothetical protein CKAN_02474000 [Cinnamomum micranthum f. kanehirae]